MKKWKLNSWKNYPVKHIPEYDDKKFQSNSTKLVLCKRKRPNQLVRGPGIIGTKLPAIPININTIPIKINAISMLLIYKFFLAKFIL